MTKPKQKPKCKYCNDTGRFEWRDPNNIRNFQSEYCHNCQQPEQKECEHKWIMLDEIVQCCKCQIPKPDPQPTDGLIDTSGLNLFNFLPAAQNVFCYIEETPNERALYSGQAFDIRQLLAEQKQKTREDTIDEVLRALELNDDHEVPKIVIKALKSKKQ